MYKKGPNNDKDKTCRKGNKGNGVWLFVCACEFVCLCVCVCVCVCV